MLFNSFSFFVFLTIVFLFYWLLKNQLKAQNFFVLLASYFFYGWWDWRFLALVFISSFVDFFLGIYLGKTDNRIRRKILLATSVFVNIGILGFFKYFNFFIESFSILLQQFGMNPNISTLQIILPVGISFYTFQTLSYTIDIYRKEIEPAKDVVAFFAFVSFFPQLVAGPIERARSLVPQFLKKRNFDVKSATDGMRQILWGLFKKILIADNCSIYVNEIFNNYQIHSGGTLLLGAVLFGFQIYGDFSGYSDIAIGTGRLFGFNLMQNFAFPYFSRDIAEFWRRWHISLSTWFRDYVYVPLGGSKGSKILQFKNVLIIFLVSGFWHGANFTFVVWGAIHAILFIPLLLTKRNRKHTTDISNRDLIKKPITILKIIGTFLLVNIAWVFFRSPTITDAFKYLKIIFTKLTNTPVKNFEIYSKPVFFGIIIMIIFEWIHRSKKHGLQFDNWPMFIRWLVYLFIAYAIFLYGNFSQVEFIYFAF
ncbi:MAG: MBOAT family protein [Bacteroidetes bacterium]|nr:MBOAT family protein [Bacteroidota bacterium]